MEVTAGELEAVACPICKEPVVEAPYVCPSCNAAHHVDCWEYSGGCSTYGCERTANWRSTPKVDEHAAPTGKILLAQMSFGAYDGVYFVPPVAGALTILFELIGLLGPVAGFPILGLGLAAMCACIAWIATTSERYYLDLDERVISKAKSLKGADILEWNVLRLSKVRRLALIPIQRGRGMAPSWVLAAITVDDELLSLAPPMSGESEPFRRARALLAKLRANNVFPVEVPAAARLGAPPDVLAALTEGLDALPPGETEEGIEVLETQGVPDSR